MHTPAEHSGFSASTAPADEREACFHCGLPVPSGSDYVVTVDGEPRPMCCRGCEAVAQAIVDGVVSISKSLADGRRQIVGFMFPGDFLGVAEEALYSCTAQAVTPVELCRFPRQSFEALAEECPEIEHRLLHAVSTELVEAQEHLLIIGRQTAEERLCSFLLHLNKRAPHRGWPDNPVHLPMSRGDIGDYLGLSLETVSRTFTVLRDQGLVALTDAHTIEVRNKDELLRLAEGA